MCSGRGGGWLGGSVVGLGGSTAIPGGDGGMCEGGGETASTGELGCLVSSAWLGEEILAGGSA